jgi:hypothetical protein
MKKVFINTIIIFVILFCFSIDLNAQKDKKKTSKTKNQTSNVINYPSAYDKQNINQNIQPSISVLGKDAEVIVKGVGITREDALKNALRLSIEQAVGVALSSETKVENFIVIKDAISTRAEGYITKYEIINEIPFPDRYEVTVKAMVSLDPIKADFNILSKSVGGIRFLVMYDDRALPENDIANYEFAVERINEFLSHNGYRYIDKKRFDELKKESKGMLNDIKPTEESYIQYLGMKADAQFIIYIKNIQTINKSEAFDTRTSSKAVIECKVYDNCTAEGLGTVVLESDWKSVSGLSLMPAITEAIEKNLPNLLNVFTRYIGNWVNNGTPFELRFYHTGTYRELRELRAKLQSDPDFGGDFEIVSFDNFTKLNCTFKNRPDQLADKVLDYADAIPELASKKLDVKYIYGRQINFAPANITLEELNISKP